jgi:hypothetical protein
MRIIIDIDEFLGKRFGRLIILKEVERTYSGKTPSRNILCKCDCGKETVTSFRSVRAGRTTSCGCYGHESSKQLHTTHGLCFGKDGKRAPEYVVWIKMKHRCFNPKNKDFHHYGGRGITVCERWLHSFENFINDIGWRPDSTYSIERINVNGNYCPENCKWILKTLQNRNTRASKYIEYSGRSLLLTEWCRELDIDYSMMRRRISDLKISFEEALKYPKGMKVKYKLNK